MPKTIHYEIFTPQGRLLEHRWENAKFDVFTKEINGGLGECAIDLGEEFDWNDESLELFNEVQVWVADADDTGKGKLVYRGYISNFTRLLEGGNERILVYLLGYHTLFAQDIWKNGSTTTFDYEGNPTDIGTIFRALMTRCVTETELVNSNIKSKMNFSLDSIKTTGTTTEYRFDAVTYREGIDVLRSLAPTNWFWYVDENGTVWFRSKPTSPTHQFILGRHFSKIDVNRSMEKIRNAVLFAATTLDELRMYTNDGSIFDYGRRVTKISDNKVGVTGDMRKIGDAYIAEHGDPDIKVEAEIIDDSEDATLGYDTESINPGDTCNLIGFDESLNDVFKDNMLITKVEYHLNKVIITVEPMKTGIVNRTESIHERVDAIERKDIPTAYT